MALGFRTWRSEYGKEPAGVVRIEEHGLRFDPPFDLQDGPLQGQKLMASPLGGGIEIREIVGREPPEGDIDVALNIGRHLRAEAIPGFSLEAIPGDDGLAVVVAMDSPGSVVKRFVSTFGTHEGIYPGGRVP